MLQETSKHGIFQCRTLYFDETEYVSQQSIQHDHDYNVTAKQCQYSNKIDKKIIYVSQAVAYTGTIFSFP